MRVLTVTTRMPRTDRPTTMAPVARQIESLRAAGVEMDVLEVMGSRRFKYLQSLSSFWSMVPRADLIHAHFGYCGWLARTQIGKPVVVSFMGSDLLGVSDDAGRASAFSSFAIQVNRQLAKRVDAVIVKSDEMAEIIAPVEAHVIPNGVDISLFRPMEMMEAKATLGLPQSTRYILFPGSPKNPRKNFRLAKLAVDAASTRLGETLEILALDRVAPEQVPLYMNACDVMLLTSFWEGSPNVVKEAMACNRPIVTVPVGDVNELLSGVNGGNVGTRDAGDLADLLVQTLRAHSNSDGRLALVRKGLDLESVASKVIEVYQQVLGSRSTESRAAA